MRELTRCELSLVAGGGEDQCSDGGGNSIVGVTDPTSLGTELIQFYESLIEATSYVIERVANAL